MATWYAWIDGREQGPFPPEDMRFLVRTGKITEDTMVRRSDLADPVRAGSVKGLIPKSEVIIPERLPLPPRRTSTVQPPPAPRNILAMVIIGLLGVTTVVLAVALLRRPAAPKAAGSDPLPLPAASATPTSPSSALPQTNLPVSATSAGYRSDAASNERLDLDPVLQGIWRLVATSKDGGRTVEHVNNGHGEVFARATALTLRLAGSDEIKINRVLIVTDDQGRPGNLVLLNSGTILAITGPTSSHTYLVQLMNGDDSKESYRFLIEVER